MSENSLKIAADYLVQARKTIETRAHEHGDAFNSFTMVAQLWSIFLTNTNVARHGNTPLPIHLDAVDVAEMLSLLKKAHKVHGAQVMPEGPIDDLGYTALAGALAAELEGSKPVASSAASRAIAARIPKKNSPPASAPHRKSNRHDLPARRGAITGSGSFEGGGELLPCFKNGAG